MQKNNTTQSERLAEKLQELKVDITKDDRDKAVSQLGLTIQTISHYLNGKVRQNDTAAKLIEFFSKRIAKRDKVLES